MTGLSSDAVEPSSGSNVIPRRARPGLAGLRPHTWRRFPKEDATFFFKYVLLHVTEEGRPDTARLEEVEYEFSGALEFGQFEAS